MVAPPQRMITDIWGNAIGVNDALARIQQLWYTINQMETETELSRREIGTYICYQDELEYLVAQLNIQVH